MSEAYKKFKAEHDRKEFEFEQDIPAGERALGIVTCLASVFFGATFIGGGIALGKQAFRGKTTVKKIVYTPKSKELPEGDEEK